MNRVVTCNQCVSRRAEIAAAGKHAIRASELFRVGVPAGVSQSGCALFYSSYGVISLCAAGRLQSLTHPRRGAQGG
jgi:hypothetical protein